MQNVKVSLEEIEENVQKILSMCVCPNCPSWVECEEKGGFCFYTIGKSNCILEESGCICGACPVTEKMGLKHIYYCILGSEKEQLMK